MATHAKADGPRCSRACARSIGGCWDIGIHRNKEMPGCGLMPTVKMEMKPEGRIKVII